MASPGPLPAPTPRTRGSRLADAAYPAVPPTVGSPAVAPRASNHPDALNPLNQHMLAADGLPVHEVDMLRAAPEGLDNAGGNKRRGNKKQHDGASSAADETDADEEGSDDEGSSSGSVETDESDDEMPLVNKRQPPLEHRWNL